jgi:drug/metabolite transporter (DMT)-like permease
MCVVQFLVVSLLSLILALIFDRFFVANPFDVELIIKALPSILYVGVLSTGIAFTTQAIGQKYAAPTVSALVMSLESVFGALGGIVLLHESLSARETLGCALVFAAIILVEIPVGKRKG